MTQRILPILLTLLAVVGCGGKDKYELEIKVMTELVASQEFTTVETDIVSNDDPTMGIRTLSSIESNATFGDPFPRGHTVAKFSDIEGGPKTVRVRLRTVTGQVLIEVRKKFDMAGSRTVTVQLTRDCVGVMCPAPGGSPGLLACLAGQCVDERCDPEADAATRAMYCPAVIFCNNDAECGDVAECATNRCRTGLCVAEAVEPSACGETEYCDPSLSGGCRPRVDLATDGGVPDAAMPVCNTICFVDGNPCVAGYWQCSDAGAPTCGSLTNVSAGTSCGSGLVCDGAGACVAPTT